MKKTIALLLVVLFGFYGQAQTTSRITNLKDGFGSTYTYVGEVSGGKPNGLGLALYAEDNTAAYYAGYFTNGEFNGRGYIIFKNGTFLLGEWKRGKLYGKGASINKDDGLYVGEFFDGKKYGKGTFFYKDNGFLIGEYVADNFDGRCIYVPAHGETLTDNIYRQGKKNGTGYQYELTDKKLFEGEWYDGSWVKSTPASYTSFMKSPSFFSEKTENQIILGGVNKANKNLLHDTAFFYNFKNMKRSFGRFENGYLKSGLIIKNDDTRFIGNVSEAGAQGPGSFLKLNKFYDEGTYLDDYLNGTSCTSIDLSKKTVYYGGMKKGIRSGKGFLVDEYKTLYVGDFLNGEFTGTGWRLTPEGSFTKGTWKNGYPATPSDKLGSFKNAAAQSPKTLGETVALLKENSADDFYKIRGDVLRFENSGLVDEGLSFDDVYEGLLKIPGATKNYALSADPDDAYVAEFLKTTDFRRARLKYAELCKELMGITIPGKNGAPSYKLYGQMNEVPRSGNVISRFTIPGSSRRSDFGMYVILQKVSDSDFRVMLGAGENNLIDLWILGW